MIDISIGNKKYSVEEAKTDEERKEGLRNYEELPEELGMLFYMEDEEPQQTFNTVGMKFPIDIVFINQDLEVVSIYYNCLPELEAIINTTEYIEEGDYIAYVLEVNSNSGIELGDFLEFENESGPIMKVLAQDGSELMPLWGGERIFSRKNTVILIKKAKKANLSQSDNDFKALGKYMFKCIKVLDERKPEYVENPTK